MRTRRREIYDDRDTLLVKSVGEQVSLDLPEAISGLLDIQVEQANSRLEHVGEKRTSRQEMVAMHIATWGLEIEGGLNARIFHYRQMTVGDLLDNNELIRGQTTSVS